jgi:hypothetical protein
MIPKIVVVGVLIVLLGIFASFSQVFSGSGTFPISGGTINKVPFQLLAFQEPWF